MVVDGGSFDWERSGRFAELTQAYDGFHNMVFSEETTVGAFLLRARREGLRDFGACMSPHTAWLILQGIETLPLRMERHMRNTREGGASSWPRIRSSRAWAIRCWNRTPAMRWRKKLLPRGAGSVFSFDIKGNREQGKKFIETLQAVQPPGQRGRLPLAGDPSGQHHALPHERRGAGGAGITQGTIRLSIGLEDPDDLIDDLKRALKAAEKAGA